MIRIKHGPLTWPVSRFIVLLTIGFLGASSWLVFGANWMPGWDEIARLDRLPTLRTNATVGCVSSYDRTGGNDDGFSGKYSFIREEPDGLVIADLTGPGVITRIWTPTPSDDVLQFFFDGEHQPRIEVGFRELFLGKHPDFAPPLVGYGVGGFYSYVPIAYAQSCKVQMRAKKVQFYQINYAQYSPGTPIKTFVRTTPTAIVASLNPAAKLWSACGTDLSAAAAPEGRKLNLVANQITLTPHAATTVYRTEHPGRLVGLRLTPANAVASKSRDLVLRIAFDGHEPAVLAPLGDFFGFAWGQPAMQSLLVGTSGETLYSYFPMPFSQSAAVEIVSDRDQPVKLSAEIVVADVPLAANEGRFYAQWRRENPTQIGTPFTFLDLDGQGHLVGCVLQAQGFESGKTLFFEGDDQTTIDGRLAIHGTGSEDFFNGGWYDVPDRWEKRLSFPLSGCLGYAKQLGRTGGYRLMLGDAYVFQHHLKQTIEHSGTSNSIPTDYCAVSYWYSAQQPSPALTLPPAKDRRVVDLKEIVFPAWWQIPIHAFCFDRASLTRGLEKLGGEDVRFLSLVAAGADWFGPPFVSFTCELPTTGTYEILIDAIKGPGQNSVQLCQNEIPAGAPVNLQAENRARSGRVSLGKLELIEGKNNLMLKVISQDPKPTRLAFDLIELICVQK
jgi:hypothetical protein